LVCLGGEKGTNVGLTMERVDPGEAGLQGRGKVSGVADVVVVDGDAAIIGVGLMLESGDHYRGGFGMSGPSWGKELMADERGGENSFIV